MSPPRPHFLVLTYPLQGHIAPALRLARRLLAVAPDVLVTFSTTEAAHQRLFPAKQEEEGLNGRGDGGGGRLEFIPFSDGTEGGYGGGSDVGAFNAYMASFHAAGPRSVGALVDALAARGRPVSRVVYTLMLPWAADVARGRGVPSALYWIQPVAVFAVYHHYFHGYAGAVAEHYRRGDPSFVVELPGLAPLAVGDLPTFLTESTDPANYFHAVFLTFRDLFDTLDREAPAATVLINSCQELEVGALAAVGPHDVLPIGPVLPAGDEHSIFKQDDAKYMEWLDTKPASSVVYVSFGSLATMAREQLDELLVGLEEGRRPYLLVVRKDNKATLAEAEAEMGERLENGVVVEWCDQVRVLSHAAVGCFVTHCGWNSVAESVASGVPMVGVPKVSEQSMNARLVEREWRTGVRGQVDDGGVLRAAELRRCVEEVMGDGAAAAEVRRRAREWKRVAAEAMGNGGSSYCNLVAFVDGARSSN
ncbi:hypothetical protein PAHAL_4G095600 [Panicum hallii]|uniref:Glycosyltransferase n=1 Tax=Panicum hallii TaxID=206008 RepID=A0A2S3HI96_9POAL|nr:crocetin glucosyltransferase, chloroplastic-like [Panicum hallii]PAN23489.1 hypothetical protein PAHAL_4G095600 [Panicum hallii]